MTVTQITTRSLLAPPRSRPHPHGSSATSTPAPALLKCVGTPRMRRCGRRSGVSARAAVFLAARSTPSRKSSSVRSKTSCSSSTSSSRSGPRTSTTSISFLRSIDHRRRTRCCTSPSRSGCCGIRTCRTCSLIIATWQPLACRRCRGTPFSRTSNRKYATRTSCRTCLL